VWDIKIKKERETDRDCVRERAKQEIHKKGTHKIEKNRDWDWNRERGGMEEEREREKADERNKIVIERVKYKSNLQTIPFHKTLFIIEIHFTFRHYKKIRLSYKHINLFVFYKEDQNLSTLTKQLKNWTCFERKINFELNQMMIAFKVEIT